MLNPDSDEIILHTQFLNVDDEKGILRMHERLFKKLNLSLNCCKNGVDTIRILRSMNKDIYFKNNKIVIIMDYKLEKETGVEIIKHI